MDKRKLRRQDLILIFETAPLKRKEQHQLSLDNSELRGVILRSVLRAPTGRDDHPQVDDAWAPPHQSQAEPGRAAR